MFTVWGKVKGEKGGLKSGIATVENYKAETLRNLAKDMNLESIKIDLYNYNKNGDATLFFNEKEYCIYQDLEPVFYAEGVTL